MSAVVVRSAIVAAAILVSLLIPPGAAALPGDPGFVATSLADGAALAIDPDGIGVAYTCPVYRTFDGGGGLIADGGPKDYGSASRPHRRSGPTAGWPTRSASTTATVCPASRTRASRR